MKTPTIRVTGIVIAGAVFAIAASTSAMAQEATVSARDLDPGRAEDTVILYKRIRRTARRVCTAAETPADGQRFSNRKRCIADAVDVAVAHFDSPLLTALHRRTAERLASL